MPMPILSEQPAGCFNRYDVYFQPRCLAAVTAVVARASWNRSWTCWRRSGRASWRPTSRSASTPTFSVGCADPRLFAPMQMMRVSRRADDCGDFRAEFRDIAAEPGSRRADSPLRHLRARDIRDADGAHVCQRRCPCLSFIAVMLWVTYGLNLDGCPALRYELRLTMAS